VFDIIGEPTRDQTLDDWKRSFDNVLPEPLRRNVNFLGGMPNPEVLRCLPNYRYAYFASVVENFPYSHMESMASGVACVIASGGGAKELIQESNAAVPSQRKASSIAAALNRLLDNESSWKEMGHAARRTVATHFDAAFVMEATCQAYERAVECVGRATKDRRVVVRELK
jgi:glycosyltransferase involved in cell wall biosynthesis